MKWYVVFTLLFLTPFVFSQGKWTKTKMGLGTFFRGFGGPVYRTDADFKVIGVSDSNEYIISSGLKYRKLDEEDGYIYLKVLPQVYTDKSVVKTSNDKTNNSESSGTLYKVQVGDIKKYNMIWQQGLSWSTLILPLKYRSPTFFNGARYERTFATDISIGPFAGYKVAWGKSYNNFFQIGGFFGPTLIQFPTTINPGAGQANQSSVTNDNLIGITYGVGAITQFDNLQIGFIYGADLLGGEKSKQWQYDGKPWVSFAVGYKFLN